LKEVDNLRKAIVFFMVILGLGCSTIYYAYSFYKEKEKLRTAIIPSLKNDYFTSIMYNVDAFKEVDKVLEFRSEEDAKKYNIENPFQVFYGSDKEILEIPIISQMPDYPNGCEAVSATMFLNYYGINLSVSDFINNYLPMQKVYEKNGIRYGPNPANYYAGNPTDTYRGWGVFAPVIEKSLQEALKNTKYLVNNRVGTNLNYLVTDLPAIIWVGIDYKEVTDTYMWFNEMETEVYTYPKNAHVVLLVGYDHDYFYLNDPLYPEKVQKVERNILERSYNSMGRQALVVQEAKKNGIGENK